MKKHNYPVCLTLDSWCNVSQRNFISGGRTGKEKLDRLWELERADTEQVEQQQQGSRTCWTAFYSFRTSWIHFCYVVQFGDCNLPFVIKQFVSCDIDNDVLRVSLNQRTFLPAPKFRRKSCANCWSKQSSNKTTVVFRRARSSWWPVVVSRTGHSQFSRKRAVALIFKEETSLVFGGRKRMRADQ
jgi:hypothetical protein